MPRTSRYCEATMLTMEMLSEVLMIEDYTVAGDVMSSSA
jgi:hypothetical protein